MKKLTTYLCSAFLLFNMIGCGAETTDPITIEEVASFETILNQYRTSIGCPELTWSPQLAKTAQKHSEDMSQNNYFDHINQQGKTPFDRMKDDGLLFTRAAENIARGSLDPQRTLDQWLNSPGHKANIDNCSYTHHGVGMDQAYWTHMFFVPSA